MIIDRIIFLAKAMKQSCLITKNTPLSRLFQSSRTGKTPRELIDVIPNQNNSFIILLSCMPSNTNWFANWGSLQWRRWLRLCKILCKIDKHAIFLRFLRLIKMSKERILQHWQIRSVFWAIEEERFRICISKINLSSSVTPRRLSVLEISRSSPHKVNGGWGVQEKLIVIECV